MIKKTRKLRNSIKKTYMDMTAERKNPKTYDDLFKLMTFFKAPKHPRY